MFDFVRRWKSEWEKLNPVLRDGEPGIERDSSQMKVGDGKTAWKDLTFLKGAGGSTFTLPERLSESSLKSQFQQAWQPNAVYAKDETVISPSGQIVSAKVAFTSGSTYSASNWNIKSFVLPGYLEQTALNATYGPTAPALPLTPGALPGLALWLRADTITGLADGAPVTAWTDASPAAATVTQTDTTRQPVYRTNQINGLPGVVFDGTDDKLDITGTGLSMLRNVTGCTAIAVGKPDATATSQEFLTVATGNTTVNRLFLIARGDDKRFRVGSRTIDGGPHPRFSAGSMTGVPVAVAGRIDFTRAYAELWQDGQPVGFDSEYGPPNPRRLNTSDTPSLSAKVGSALGSAEFFKGPICELIVFNRTLTDPELRGVMKYLAAKWGTPYIEPLTRLSAPLQEDSWHVDVGAITATDGAGIATLADISGHGSNLTQTTAANQPTYVAATKTLTLDGTSKFLTAGTGEALLNVLPTERNGLHLFLAASTSTTAAGTATLFSQATTADTTATSFQVARSGSQIVISTSRGDTATLTTLTGGTLVANQLTLIEVEVDYYNGFLRARQDGTLLGEVSMGLTAPAVAAASNRRGTYIGRAPDGSGFWAGAFAGGRAWRRRLSDTEARVARADMAARFGIVAKV